MRPEPVLRQVITPIGNLAGDARGTRALAAFGPLERLDDALALRYVDVQSIGTDLRILARPADRES